MFKLYSFSVLLLFLFSANAQTISLVAENYLTINGGRFNNKKIVFAKAEGNWFSTNNDAHGSLTFYATNVNGEIKLDLEWAGKTEPHIITNELRHTDNGHKGDFILTMPDKTVYGDGLNAYPNGGEEVKINVTKIDDQNVIAEISGTVTNNRDHMQVSGMISLKKSSLVKTSDGTAYKGCDNVIHDKLAGAENRSCTECEALFDQKTRKAFHQALLPAIQKLSNEWTLEREDNDDELITATARSMGKPGPYHLYRMGFAKECTIQLKLNPGSDEGQKREADYEEAMSKNADTDPNSLDKAKADAREMAMYAYFNNGIISIYAEINNPVFTTSEKYLHHEILNYGNLHVLTAYGLKTQYGSSEIPQAITFIYAGNWAPLKIVKNEDGSENISIISPSDKAGPELSIQRLGITIKCKKEIAKQLVSNLNPGALIALMQ